MTVCRQAIIICLQQEHNFGVHTFNERREVETIATRRLITDHGLIAAAHEKNHPTISCGKPVKYQQN
jgi:hypothetical protein